MFVSAEIWTLKILVVKNDHSSIVGHEAENMMNPGYMHVRRHTESITTSKLIHEDHSRVTSCSSLTPEGPVIIVTGCLTMKTSDTSKLLLEKASKQRRWAACEVCFFMHPYQQQLCSEAGHIGLSICFSFHHLPRASAFRSLKSTLTVHFIRCTLLVSSWHRFKKVT